MIVFVHLNQLMWKSFMAASRCNCMPLEPYHRLFPGDERCKIVQRSAWRLLITRSHFTKKNKTFVRSSEHMVETNFKNKFNSMELRWFKWTACQTVCENEDDENGLNKQATIHAHWKKLSLKKLVVHVAQMKRSECRQHMKGRRRMESMRKRISKYSSSNSIHNTCAP